MSRSEAGSDRRFRVFCPACDWHADATHPNSLVASAEAERHDDRNHDGEETADVEAVNVVTDGGREGWFSCVCGAEYRNAGAAIQCCSDRLDDVDHGEEIVTDGGQTTTRRETDVTFFQAVCTTCDSPMTVRRLKSRAKTDRRVHKERDHDVPHTVEIIDFESDAFGQKALDRPDYDDVLADYGGSDE